jgi:hypothetical protein
VWVIFASCLLVCNVSLLLSYSYFLLAIDDRRKEGAVCFSIARLKLISPYKIEIIDTLVALVGWILQRTMDE